MLVPQLSSSAIIEKDRLQAEHAQRQKRLDEDNSALGAARRWWHYSVVRRVIRDVVDLVNPFDNTLNLRRHV